MSLQSAIRWFLPKEEGFYEVLERQAAAIGDAAAAWLLAKEGKTTLADLQRDVQIIEHRGDELVGHIEDTLARTFITPIDREDIHELASKLDDVVDAMNLAARAAVLYGVQRPTPPMNQLVTVLAQCADIVKRAVPMLRLRQYESIAEECRKLRKIEKDADAVFRTAVSNLFHDPAVDAKQLLREKEVLEDLEEAVDQCDEVANMLSNIAVKNG